MIEAPFSSMVFFRHVLDMKMPRVRNAVQMHAYPTGFPSILTVSTGCEELSRSVFDRTRFMVPNDY